MRFLVRALSGLVGLVVIVAVGLFLWHPDAAIQAIGELSHSTRNSTAYGSALVVPSGQGGNGDLQINLQGLTSQLRYVVTLNQGNCNGPVLRTFNGVTADNSGTISNSFSLSDFNYSTQPSLWINVHEGDSADGASVVCGQVQVNKTLLLNPTPTTGVARKPTPAIQPATPTVATSSSNTDPYIGDGAARVKDIPDLPHTGVDMGDDNTYDNYSGHHKY